MLNHPANTRDPKYGTSQIEYDTVNAAFLFPIMGEQDAAFFMPKWRKEATPCYLLPALTGRLNG